MARAPIRITEVRIGDEEKRAVLRVLDSGQLAQGPVVAELERQFAAICGVPHAVAVSNGTVALVAALQALGLGPGDEVITTPFSFAATLNAILESGATPGSPTSGTISHSTRTRWPHSSTSAPGRSCRCTSTGCRPTCRRSRLWPSGPGCT